MSPTGRGHPMTTLTFDTLAYVKTLREAGVPEPPAEAQAGALAEVLRQGTGDLVTKQDLAVAVADIHREIETMKADLLKWVVGLFIAQVGLFAALVKLLH